MKFAVHFTVLLVAVVTLGVGALIYHFAPRAQVPQVRSMSDTRWQSNNVFVEPNINNATPDGSNADTTQNNIIEDTFSFLNSWQDTVEHATSARIANITESTISTTTYSKEEQEVNLGGILSRINEQLQTIGQGSVTDDDVNSLIYRESTVDLGGAVKVTSKAGTEELRKYGNALATELTSFRLAHSDQLAVLDTFIKNSSNSGAGEALISLANAYSSLSKDIGMLNAPSDVTKINQGISNALADISNALLELAEARADTEIYKKSIEYNKKSEDLAKFTLKLIDIFLFSDVRFKSSEPGSIFMFK